MQYDYYAYRQEKLDEAKLLNNLEQAVIDLKRARGNLRQDAERKMNQVAEQILQFEEGQEIEPHLPYFWYDIQSSDCKNYIRNAWQKNLTIEKIPEDFQFIPNISELANLPALSFILRVPFKLQKPYLSKGDRSFHLLDNPIQKDKVFQTPMVSSTSWKGALRAALWQLRHQVKIQKIELKNWKGSLRVALFLYAHWWLYIFIWHKEESEQIIRLFGNEREEEDHEKLKSGRLYFYPTFFDKIGLEVINPHDRQQGTGKNPILIESVPIGATGKFVVLYVPFGKVEKNQVIEDLELVVKGVKAMLTTYGFGAKTSSGFGIVEQQSTGQMVINYLHTPQILPRPQEPEYPEKLRLFLEQYPDEDFQLKPDEWRKLRKASQSARQLYQEARKERLTYQEKLNTYESDLAKWKTDANAPPLPQKCESFKMLDEMLLKAQEIAEYLRQRKEISHDS